MLKSHPERNSSIARPWSDRLRTKTGIVLGTVAVAFVLAAGCGGGGGSSGGEADASRDGGSSWSNGGAGGRQPSSSGGKAGESDQDAGSGGRTDAANVEGGTGGTSGLAFPLTLTPLGRPDTSTAHVGLYFSVTDANDEPVSGLSTEDFVAREGVARIDRFESKFQVDPPTGSLVRVPAVLLLDLSRSVLEQDAIGDVKEAAKIVVAELGKSKNLAIVTFAGNVLVRAPFGSDETALSKAVTDIKEDEAQGISTNLYGAIEQSYAMWTDGFYPYDPGARDPQLVAGVLIVVTDGNDTAGTSTLAKVLATRGTKRTIFIRVGEELDENVASAIGKDGFIKSDNGFQGLKAAVEDAVQRIERSNSSIYIAEYCSPKRAGQHELVFTVAGNEDYAKEPTRVLCSPSGSGPACNGTDTFCEYPDEDTYACCPAHLPFHCGTPGTFGHCFATAELAHERCGNACTACGVVEEETDGDNLQPGPAISVSFNAGDYNDDQCASLFGEPSRKDGGMPDGGATADSGGPVDLGCGLLFEAVSDVCGTDVETITCDIVQIWPDEPACSLQPGADRCEREAAALLQCLSDLALEGGFECDGSYGDCLAPSYCSGEQEDYLVCLEQ